MEKPRLDRFARVAVCVLSLLASACTDDVTSPARGRTPVEPVKGPSLLSVEYECRVDIRGGTVECGLAAPQGGAGPQLDLLLLAPQARVVPKGSATFYRGTSQDTVIFSLALVNLLPQPIGTTDGVTAAPSGTRLVVTGYAPLIMNATLDNADGTATFIDSLSSNAPYTFANRQYISYPGVLATNDTSQAKTLRFVYNPSSTMFQFKYRISAPVQHEYGFISLTSAPVLVLAPGDTGWLTGTVYSGFGVILSDGITWASSNPSVASVNASTGQVTAVAQGTATITATSTVHASRTGTRNVIIDEAPEVSGTTPGNGDLVLPWDVIVIDFTEPVNVSSSTFSIECPTASSQAFTVSGSGTSTITLDPVNNLPPGTTCTVTVNGSQLSDTDGFDGPNQMTVAHGFSFGVI
jgi:hypothetical protein